MTALTWDDIGERLYETGVDHGVLYIPDNTGVYDTGVAWNGLTTVTEQPSGADSTPQFADNIKYLNLIAAELFGATLEAFTYPDEFAQFDGMEIPTPGITVGQQNRGLFGLCYRTVLGNDIEGTDFGYKLHMIYGAQATPSEKAYATINDSPAAIAFSWTISTTPVPVTGYKPSSLITLDSTKVDATVLDDLLLILYGDVGVEPRLPLPDEIITMFAGTITVVDLSALSQQPTYNSGTHTITYPSVAHITWMERLDDTVTGQGTPAAKTGTRVLTSTQTAYIKAVADPGYRITGDDDWVFDY